MAGTAEHVDVLIVGARCAGSAAAAVFARAGRRVVVLDRARFPSDTLSTHVLFPMGVAELARIGALERVLELDPSPLSQVRMDIERRASFRERFGPVDGIDYGICVPRPEQDAALVANARALGADVRERCDVVDVVWQAGRASGVRYREGETLREVRAHLVVGADGRRSTVAACVGSWHPYRASRNGRGLVFRYLDDPRAGTEDARTMRQWRDGESIAFAFPCTPRGRLLILFMGDRDEVALARSDPERAWEQKLAQHPGVAERYAGATNVSKIRSTGDTPAFFRASSGPGWALAGDAGHFKDPIIGQGMRDAMWMGRTLAETTISHLEDPTALDRALLRWEHERDLECLPAYHFGNLETRVQLPSPLLTEVVRGASNDVGEPDISDVFQRIRTPQQVFHARRMRAAILAALRNPEHKRGDVLRAALAELRIDLAVRREQRAGSFRSARRIPGSEHPDWQWPDPPRRQPAPEATRPPAVTVAAPASAA